MSALEDHVADARPSSAVGTVLGGNVKVERHLGRGGTADVYAGIHQSLEILVAVKIIHPELLGSAAALERLFREARALSMLSHESLARVYSHGTDEKLGHYLILEFVEGVTLAEAMAARRLSPEEAVDITRQICAGLESIHAAGLVHRDLKPSNIMVKMNSSSDGGWGVKIIDFGLVALSEFLSNVVF